jgi:hypothetical protein
MDRKDIISGVLEAAGEFNNRKLWKRFTNYDCFGVRIVGQDELMLGVVLGDAGEQYGLSLFRGEQAATSLAAILDAEGPGDDALEDMDMLGFSTEAFGDLPPDAQALLREAGRHPRYDEQVPHFLWGWMDDWQATSKPSRLCSTDGEEFLWHIGSFSVADQNQTRQALLRRKDIEPDEEADEFVWNKEARPDSRMLGETVTLGRMEFVGDELIVTVNSAERFARARQWLEKLPGVVFRNVTTRCWDEAEQDRPMDERVSRSEPVEMTPELTAAMQEMMNQHYMAWIDERLPALGGKTPRQACRTETGRQQVLMLIRTMPDPMAGAAVRVPRESMLRELGLAEEASKTPSVGQQIPDAPIPIEAVRPESKVPRNAPCPCGSGRKYKKCCGRESR